MSSSANDVAPAVRRSVSSPVAITLAFGLLAAFAAQLWFCATHTSPTLDEPYHLLAGYRALECGDFGINTEHPPLSKLLAAWPIRARNLVEPPWPCGSRMTPLGEGFQAGMRFVVDNGIARIIVPARFAESLTALLLAVLVALAAWEMFGRIEALTALALFAFEPTVVAHGSLVTNDMMVTLGIFAAAYMFYRFAKKPTVARAVMPGLALGVALAAKHSALVAVPILCALPLLDILSSRRRPSTTTPEGAPVRATVSHAIGVALLAPAIALGVLWASYGFRSAPTPAPGDGASVARVIRETPHPEAIASPVGEVATFLERSHIVPQAYALGLGYVAGFSSRSTYILGARLPEGVWYYFPIAFSIKTSIPLLVSLVLGLTVCGLFRSHAREMLFLVVVPVAFFAVSMTSHINIGIRHVLPVYPFAAVVGAAGLCIVARQRRVLLVLAMCLLVYHAATAIRALPDDIAFANDAWGGTRNVHRLLHDSNVDWGQTLGEVATLRAQPSDEHPWMASYGDAELAAALVPNARQLPGPGWTNVDAPVEAVPPQLTGTVLVSASVATGPLAKLYEPITSREPDDVLGGAILVYRGTFDVPMLAAASHLDRAEQLDDLGRFDDAVVDLREAVALAPTDTSTHLALGIGLARAGRRDEARAELESVERVASADPNGRALADEARRALSTIP